MVNTELLRKKIEEAGASVSGVAAKMGIDRATLYRRMSDAQSFTIGEAIRIANILNLTHDEASLIFFGEEVA